MKRLCFILFLSLALLTGCSSTEGLSPDSIIPVPASIVNDGIPPLSAEIRDRMKPYADMKSAAFCDWNPAGNGMVISTRMGNTTQLYSIESPRDNYMPITDFDEPVRDATFCPDRSKGYLIFPRDVGGGEAYQYFRHELDSGETVMITDGTSRHMGLVFNHRGDRAAYVNNSRTGSIFDLYVMDPEFPDSAQRVYEAPRTAYFIPTSWFYDDRRILLIEYISANVCNSFVVDTVSGSATQIRPPTDESCFFAMFTVAPDGKTLYGISDCEGEFKRLVTVNLDTGKVIPVGEMHWDVEDVAVTEDFRTLAFVLNEGGVGRLYLLDTASGEILGAPSVPIGLISGITFDPEGKRLAFTLNRPRMNGDVYVLDLETSGLTRWTESDTAGLDPSLFSEPELIEYPTFDRVDGKRRRIPAFYFRPSKSPGPHPVVIYLHGGPESQYQPRFSATFNYWINELGLAILAPNVRGSSGYGKSYLLLDNGTKRENSVKDVGALLDWIAKQPELDRQRVAVFGGSYGGYMVLASMFHYSDRLACGVDFVGISNFVTFLENTADYRRDLRRAEYGDEREIEAFLNRISPTTNAHRIHKPLFVIQGKNDPRVPWTEAEQIVEIVRKNNVPVWYQMATNEGHGFSKKNNRDYMYYSVARFFQKFLLR